MQCLMDYKNFPLTSQRNIQFPIFKWKPKKKTFILDSFSNTKKLYKNTSEAEFYI